MLITQRRQGIEQVVHIEANGQITDLRVSLDFFLRLFLFSCAR